MFYQHSRREFDRVLLDISQLPQGDAPQVIRWFLISLIVDTPSINHSYWSFVHQLINQLNALERGHQDYLKAMDIKKQIEDVLAHDDHAHLHQVDPKGRK